MRVVDQIGANLLSSGDDKERGLIVEKITEFPNFQFNPNILFNFVRIRFPQLVGDKEKRKQVYKILGKKEPEKIDFYKNIEIENKTVSAAIWLKALPNG